MTRLKGAVFANYTRDENGDLGLDIRWDQRRAPNHSPLTKDDTFTDLSSVGPRKYWQYATGRE